MANKIEKLSHEDLVAEYGVRSAQEAMYPRQKTYIKKRLACEKELIRRLGGSWEEYCRINGFDVAEVDKMLS